MFLADPVAIVPHRRDHGRRRRLLGLLARPRCGSLRRRRNASANRTLARRVRPAIDAPPEPPAGEVDHLVGPALGDDARRRAPRRRRWRWPSTTPSALRFDASGRVGAARVHGREPVAVGRHGGDGERRGPARPARRAGRAPGTPPAGPATRRCRRGCRAGAPAPPPGSAGPTAPNVPSRSTITSVADDANTQSRPSAPTGTTARLATVWPGAVVHVRRQRPGLVAAVGGEEAGRRRAGGGEVDGGRRRRRRARSPTPRRRPPSGRPPGCRAGASAWRGEPAAAVAGDVGARHVDDHVGGGVGAHAEARRRRRG